MCVYFSDGQGFWLTLVFFAYKDRQQITELFNCFSITATAFYGSKVSPCDLWQKNDAIMTDAVTVEALDGSNLDVLTKIE